MPRARFDRLAACGALALALEGCGLLLPAPWNAGEDPRGRAFKQRAGLIVAALQHYRADNGHLPGHLFELAPKYLSVLPDGLKTSYEPDKNRIAFAYSPAWPDAGLVNCSTKIDAIEWDCYGYI